MFQVVAVPYRNAEKEIRGAIVAAHLINNDNSIAQQVASSMPNSFSTVSVHGIRVAGNLASEQIPTYVGLSQSPDLTMSIQLDQRFYGHVRLADDWDHLVVSDPIHNAKGQVIGALTTGHPSQGLASLKRDTVLYIVLSALLCWGAVFVGSAMASRRWAVPIIDLSKLAKRIYEAEVVRPEHLALVEGLPSATTREIEDLQLCFSRMTVSLYEKNQEILGYLYELRVERNELKRVADQLQEANATLEARVAEKTFELRNAMTDLVASSNLKSKFLASTSHELRTPLNSIIGFADMLTSGIYGSLTEHQRDRVAIIADSARYLLKLINDLLDVSMVEQGKLTLDRQCVDVNDLVTSVLTIIRNDCDQNRVSIAAELGAALPRVSADPTRIKQVLYNVLSNAVKFTPEGGEIAVRTGTSTNEVVVSIRDTGVGISESDQLYVFDEFYQGENAHDRKREGFGLGLSLSRRLVELHGGRVELKSTLGEGTTVTLYIPSEHVGEADLLPAG